MHGEREGEKKATWEYLRTVLLCTDYTAVAKAENASPIMAEYVNDVLMRGERCPYVVVSKRDTNSHPYADKTCPATTTEINGLYI